MIQFSTLICIVKFNLIRFLYARDNNVFLDIFQTTDILKISAERPVPVLEPIKAINLLGGAANVANNIKSIGGSPFLISKLSNDAACKTIKKLLIDKNIDVIIDDTDENFSSKLKKFNLIGVPYQILIGKRSEGDLLEFKEIGKETQHLLLNQIIDLITKQKDKI